MNISNSADFIISAVAVIVALTVHEFFHSFTAYKLGDPTPGAQGRLSLNPIHHLDPIGAICLLVFNFGWAKPVPINTRYFKNPKRDFALTAMAGPISNLLLAFLSGMIYVLTYKLQGASGNDFVARVMQVSCYFVFTMLVMNLGLGIFNLIPIPPLDGSRLLSALLPNKVYYKLLKYERTIYRVFIFWLLLGTPVYNMLMGIDFIASNPILRSVFSILSIGNLISRAVSFLGEYIIKFWIFCLY